MLKENDIFEVKKMEELKGVVDFFNKKVDVIIFEVEIVLNGVDLFFKENYLLMKFC